jgi:3-phenylpropionate/cinnamic acid dioxygenase small subunit
MGGQSAGAPVSDGEFLEIQRFVHHETALLDRHAYKSWFDLLTEDIVYRVTTQVVRPTETGVLRHAIVDERATALKLRVDQISDPRLTRAENPPTLIRRFVSNLQATHAAPPDTFGVETNLLVYRQRATAPDGGLYVGVRRDLLRRMDGRLRIARRDVDLDQSFLRDGALSTLL